MEEYSGNKGILQKPELKEELCGLYPSIRRLFFRSGLYDIEITGCDIRNNFEPIVDFQAEGTGLFPNVRESLIERKIAREGDIKYAPAPIPDPEDHRDWVQIHIDWKDVFIRLMIYKI